MGRVHQDLSVVWELLRIFGQVYFIYGSFVNDP